MAYAGRPAVSSATDGSWGGCGCNVRGADSRRARGAALEERVCDLGRLGLLMLLVLDKEKGVTPARLAISCSPSCQCMASAALHGIDISSATGAHIWCLNLAGAVLASGLLLLSHTAPHTSRTTWRAYFYDPHPTHFSSPDNSGNANDS